MTGNPDDPARRLRLDRPTQFPELNRLLADLTHSLIEILGDNLVGVYLQGSFAVGDADLASDCDFLVPVHERPSAAQEAALRDLHDQIPTRPGHWTRHLEGSYPIAAELQTLDHLGRPWLFVDHGSRVMEWSDHCNNPVARWSLRQCGVTLSGPRSSKLVDPIPAEALRQHARHTVAIFMPAFDGWMSLEIGWGQRYAVTQYCRCLATIGTARVLSKKAALPWAAARLDPTWRPLLEAAHRERRGFDPDEVAPPDRVEQTRAFAGYVEELVRTDPTLATLAG